jgi:NET1-associated nuclear protein 1 (U3 small nucleolar RNA-associated protein 17)
VGALETNMIIGNYVISGGTETVLVLWQLDTGKQQFLPHMSATIQNVVTSPSGSSYGIQLADNSTMILSTAELQPTANIAGIQACVLESEPSLESQVQRLEEERYIWPLIQHTPAVINPRDPSRLLLGVGQMQEVNPSKPLVMSVPYLQTFDLGSGHNLSRQALTRSNITNTNTAPSSHRISEPRVIHMKISHDGNWLATVDEWIPPLPDLEFLGHQNKDPAGERQHRREVYLKFWQWSKENDTWELVSRIDAPHSLGNISCRILDLASDPSSLRFSTIGEDSIVRIWSTKTRKRDGVVVRGKDGKTFRNWYCQHAISLGKPRLFRLFKESESLGDSETVPRKSPPATACVAFSEDGSLLAAACGGDNNGLLHLLDPDSGAIRLSHNDLFEGEIAKMGFLGQNLITLSNKVLVFDLVLDEVKYGIKLDYAITSLSAEQKQEMMHLAVDGKNGTFAVALPAKYRASHVTDLREESLLTRFSELAIFQLDKREPVLKEAFSTLITALLPATSSNGYLVLDTAAEIRTILKKGTQAITTRAQSTSALKLDTTAEEPTGDLLYLVDDAGESEEMEEFQPSTLAEIQDDDDNESPVVTQQQLSQIFNIGPSFALPPLEEMFYQVAGLFSSKPLAQSV